MTRRQARVSLALVTVLTSQLAVMQRAHADDNDDEYEAKARALHAEGSALYEEGEYQAAISRFERAYALSSAPGILFNIAQAYRQQSNCREALVYYRRFDETSHRKSRALVADRIDEMEACIAEGRNEPEPEPEPAPEPAPGGDEISGEAAGDRTAREGKTEGDIAPVERPQGQETSPSRRQTSPAVPPAEGRSRGRGLRIAGLGAAGAAVAFAGAGAFFGARTAQISNELSGADTFDSRRYAQGRSANRRMIIASSVGATFAVAGGVLYYLGHRRGVEASSARGVTVSPSSRGGLVITATGAF